MSPSKNNGNVLFLILIAVALFAMLSYAVTSSMRNGNTGDTGNEKVELGLSALMQYTTYMKTVSDRLIIRGCEKTELTVAGAAVKNSTSTTTYRNPNASTTDKSCWFFDRDGGGASNHEVDEAILDRKFSGLNGYRSVLFERNLGPAGTASYSVRMVVPYINDKACLEINRRFSEINNIPVSTNSYTFLGFTGWYSPGGYFSCTGGPKALACGAAEEGCFRVNGTTINSGTSGGQTVNIFYKRLITSAAP